MSSRPKTPVDIVLIEGERRQALPDELVTEDPLEIRTRLPGGEVRTLAVTMRTPGEDPELALGFLHSEGLVTRWDDVAAPPEPVSPDAPGATGGQIVVDLVRAGDLELRAAERGFLTSSSCGLCGKASLAALGLSRAPELPAGPRVCLETLHSLPEKLRAAQGLFRSTGGLHAAALFEPGGDLVALREDVGRHNALDKLVGWAFLEGRLPLHDHLLLVSGRSSYEILQKSLMAEVPIVCSVSAPSSLAVATAREYGVTLVGFLRQGRLNVYSGIERIGS